MALKLNYLVKKFLPGKLLGILRKIYYRDSYPYNLVTELFVPESISDFFVWNPYVKRTEFIAENIRSLLTGRRVEVMHHFKYFSEFGEFIFEEKHMSDQFFSRIKLKGPSNVSSYNSFIHFVSSKESLQNYIENKLGKKKRVVCEQNRGYCIYYPKNNSELGSSVHGNFGGISRNIKLYARQRSFHLYTPVVRFEIQNNYDLVFNNPTHAPLKIKVIFNNSSKKSKTIQLKSLGTFGLRISNYEGSLTFESRLPICRPIIFKNPDNIKTSNFDVFHS